MFSKSISSESKIEKAIESQKSKKKGSFRDIFEKIDQLNKVKKLEQRKLKKSHSNLFNQKVAEDIQLMEMQKT